MESATAKKALRLFTYGLYVVTSASEDGDVSVMTANWTGQVSFEPRMLSLAVEKDAHTLAVIRKSGVFAVNVLDSSQRDLAGQFGRASAKVGNKLEGYSYDRGTTGCPLLTDALASVECRVVLEQPAGDHVLFLGEVEDAHVNREGEALTLAAAGFRYSG